MTILVENIYVYPVKALRAVELQSAIANASGFEMDRTFMLIKLLADGTHQNIHTGDFPEFSFWHPSLNYSPDGTSYESITVTHRPHGGPDASITFPARPATASLEQVEVVMHKSGTKGFDMGTTYSDFFSSRLGYNVRLIYLGSNYRDVLMTTQMNRSGSRSWSAWASGLVYGSAKEKITFADCSPLLVTSRTSLEDVSKRFGNDVQMDIVKFRPNLVVKGAEAPWEEDYWAELQVGDALVDCVHNCIRCKSITVDYATGKNGTGATKDVFKKLQSDRRIDTSAKYSPVFGRYAVLGPGASDVTIKVGDVVRVISRNEERTTMGE